MPPTTWRTPSLTDLIVIARWAIAEGWPGRPKGAPLDEAEFAAIAHLPDHQRRCQAGDDGTPQAFGQVWTDAHSPSPWCGSSWTLPSVARAWAAPCASSCSRKRWRCPATGACG